MQTETAGRLKTNLEHLKHHVKYPADRNALVQACNNMSDVSEGDRTWFIATVPEGTYKGPTDVVNALLAKV